METADRNIGLVRMFRGIRRDNQDNPELRQLLTPWTSTLLEERIYAEEAPQHVSDAEQMYLQKKRPVQKQSPRIEGRFASEGAAPLAAQF